MKKISFCIQTTQKLIISQLGNAAQKYQASTNNASSQSAPELQTNCNMFVASARQLAKALEVPLVNDLGYTKRYVRCLQISEVVNSMKDLIDYSRETSIGPMECLAKFPRRTSTTSGLQSQPQQPEQQQQATQQQQNPNGMSTVNNSNPIPVTSSNGTIAGLLHQNSMNSRHQQNFKNTPQTSQNGASVLNSVGSPNMSTGDPDPNDSQSSVQKILHEMMSSSQLGGSGGDVKNFNNSGFVGNGQSGMVNGIRAAMGHNNSFGMNGRVTSHQQQQQQQDMGNQLLNGIGAVNGFNNIPFDWKSSP